MRGETRFFFGVLGIILVGLAVLVYSAPNAINVDISPSEPNVTSSLLCNYDFNSTANDTEDETSTEFRWYRNIDGINNYKILENQTARTITNTADRRWFGVDDKIKCAVKVSNGTAYDSIFRNSTFVIIYGNYDPTVTDDNNTAPVQNPVKQGDTVSFNVEWLDNDSTEGNLTVCDGEGFFDSSESQFSDGNSFVAFGDDSANNPKKVWFYSNKTGLWAKKLYVKPFKIIKDGSEFNSTSDYTNHIYDIYIYDVQNKGDTNGTLISNISDVSFTPNKQNVFKLENVESYPENTLAFKMCIDSDNDGDCDSDNDGTEDRVFIRASSGFSEGDYLVLNSTDGNMGNPNIKFTYDASSTGGASSCKNGLLCSGFSSKTTPHGHVFCSYSVTKDSKRVNNYTFRVCDENGGCSNIRENTFYVDYSPKTPFLWEESKTTNSSTTNVIGYVNESSFSNLSVVVWTEISGGEYSSTTSDFVSSECYGSFNASNFTTNTFKVDSTENFTDSRFVFFSNHEKKYFKRYHITNVGNYSGEVEVSEAIESLPQRTTKVTVCNSSYPQGWFNVSLNLFAGENTIKSKSQNNYGYSSVSNSYTVQYNAGVPDTPIVTALTTETDKTWFSVNWSASGSVYRVQYMVTNNDSEVITNGWLEGTQDDIANRNLTTESLNLVNDTWYFVHIRYKQYENGNWSDSSKSQAIKYFVQKKCFKPTTVSVSVPYNAIKNNPELKTNWTKSTSNCNKIEYYEYALGTNKYDQTGWDLISGGWVNVGKNRSVVVNCDESDCTLQHGETYYFSVRAVSNINESSDVAFSEDITYYEQEAPLSYVYRIENDTNSSDGWLDDLGNSNTSIYVKGDENMTCFYSPFDKWFSQKNYSNGDVFCGSGRNVTCNVPLPDGNYNSHIVCKDLAGNGQNSSQNVDINFKVDTLGPKINITDPKQGGSVGRNVRFQALIDDSASLVSSVKYNITNSSDLLRSGLMNYSPTEDKWEVVWNDTIEGNYTFTVFANDSLGHESTNSLNFTVDLTPPVIVIDPDLNFKELTHDSDFNITARILNFANASYNITGPEGNLVKHGFINDSVDPVNWSEKIKIANLSDGKYIVIYSAVDENENRGTKSSYFYINAAELSYNNITVTSEPIYENMDVDINITWSPNLIGGIRDSIYKVTFFYNSTGVWKNNTVVLGTSSSRTDFNFTVPKDELTENSIVYWYSTALDQAGNFYNTTVFNFSVINRPPIRNLSVPDQIWDEDTNNTLNLSNYFTETDSLDNLSFSMKRLPGGVTFFDAMNNFSKILLNRGNYSGLKFEDGVNASSVFIEREVNNLLNNSDFEQSDGNHPEDWSPRGDTGQPVYNNSGFNYSGSSGIGVSDIGYYCQQIDVITGQYYTLSAYVKSHSNGTVWLYIDNVTKGIDGPSIKIKVSSNFSRVSRTFKALNDSKEVCLRSDENSVIIDAVQLETGYYEHSFVDGNKNQSELSYSLYDVDNSSRIFDKGTLELWVKPDWSYNETGVNYLFESVDNEAGNNIELLRVGEEIGFVVGTYGVTSQINWSAEEWHHVAVSWDDNLRLYIDGELKNSSDFNSSVEPGKIYVGSNSDFNYQFDGNIDEFAIYDYPRSNGEILNDYLYQNSRYFEQNIHVTLNNSIVNFVPDTDWFGRESIEFYITDGESTIKSRIVDINVTGVNDEPVFSGTINDYTWMEDTVFKKAFRIGRYFSDVDGQDLNFGANETDKIEFYGFNETKKKEFLNGWSKNGTVEFSFLDGKADITANQSGNVTIYQFIERNITDTYTFTAVHRTNNTNTSQVNYSIKFKGYNKTNDVIQTLVYNLNPTENWSSVSVNYTPLNNTEKFEVVLFYEIMGNYSAFSEWENLSLYVEGFWVDFIPNLNFNGTEMIRFYAGDGFNKTYSNYVNLTLREDYCNYENSGGSWVVNQSQTALCYGQNNLSSLSNITIIDDSIINITNNIVASDIYFKNQALGNLKNSKFEGIIELNDDSTVFAWNSTFDNVEVKGNSSFTLYNSTNSVSYLNVSNISKTKIKNSYIDSLVLDLINKININNLFIGLGNTYINSSNGFVLNLSSVNTSIINVYGSSDSKIIVDNSSLTTINSNGNLSINKSSVVYLYVKGKKNIIENSESFLSEFYNGTTYLNGFNATSFFNLYEGAFVNATDSRAERLFVAMNQSASIYGELTIINSTDSAIYGELSRGFDVYVENNESLPLTDVNVSIEGNNWSVLTENGHALKTLNFSSVNDTYNLFVEGFNLANVTFSKDSPISISSWKLDRDGDGNPRINDTDDDNDGILDANDTLIGNKSWIRTNVDGLNMQINGTDQLNQFFNGTLFVNVTDGSGIITQFNWLFSNDTRLDLSNVKIMKGIKNGRAYVNIYGFDLSSQNNKKTVYLNQTNASLEALCVHDEEVFDISKVALDCLSGDYIDCGESQDCTKNGSVYKITGLSHTFVHQTQIQTSSTTTTTLGGGGGGSTGSSAPVGQTTTTTSTTTTTLYNQVPETKSWINGLLDKIKRNSEYMIDQADIKETLLGLFSSISRANVEEIRSQLSTLRDQIKTIDVKSTKTYEKVYEPKSLGLQKKKDENVYVRQKIEYLLIDGSEKRTFSEILLRNNGNSTEKTIYMQFSPKMVGNVADVYFEKIPKSEGQRTVRWSFDMKRNEERIIKYYIEGWRSGEPRVTVLSDGQVPFTLPLHTLGYLASFLILAGFLFVFRHNILVRFEDSIDLGKIEQYVGQHVTAKGHATFLKSYKNGDRVYKITHKGKEIFAITKKTLPSLCQLRGKIHLLEEGHFLQVKAVTSI